MAPAVTDRACLTRSAERLTDHLETPALDDRLYRVIRLSNQLEAMLVHDADTDKASAAMDVNVGAFSDPDDMPGMAHAVEHLLFMGTKKYPTENAYSQYLSSHSGYSNAYTASTSTNYYFEVDATARDGQASPFYGALDRFSQFFVTPLFLESTLDRELQAVDSENKKNLQNDMWRLNQLGKSTASPRHPYHKFSTGNLQTLRDLPRARGIDIRKEFMNFYESHYSANRMKLVVLGRESLDELESWVVELFSGVRNKDLRQPRWDEEQPLTDDQLLTQCFAKPVMDTRLLELTFPSLDEDYLYKSQPSRYIGHLIGHEGPGSILAYIKERGWATELSAGLSQVGPGASLFEISVRLTEDGLKNYPQVVKVIFQYISLIREQSPLEWIVDEIKGMAEVEFRFKQKTGASKFTSRISSVMQKPLPRAWLLSGSSLIRRFDAKAIDEALSFLRPDNFRLTLVSQDFGPELEQRERWYGTRYHMERIPQDFLDEIEHATRITGEERLPALHLPHKNGFIPTNFDVERRETQTPAKAPKLIRHDDGAKIWWKKDDSFWVPKGNVVFRVANPIVDATPANFIKTTLYCELVNDALVEYAYDAEIAGLGYDLRPGRFGLSVQISGYNDKMGVLLEKILSTMKNLDVRSDRFDVVKERLLEEYQNWDYQPPYKQIGDYGDWLGSEIAWSNGQYLAELPYIVVDDVRRFVPSLLEQFHVEGLAHGNIHKEDALGMASLVESRLRPRLTLYSQLPVRRSLILPPGSNFVYSRQLKDPLNVNSCIAYGLYIGDKADRSLRARLLLFAQMTEEPVFDQLRTKEQLGYIVFSGEWSLATTQFYRVLVQSERTPEYLEKRIDLLLANFGEVLTRMTDDEFETHKRSLVQRRLQKLKNLDQETLRFRQHIGSQRYDFEQVDGDVAAIEPLSKKDVVDFYEHYIRPDSATRAKLSVHLYAQKSTTDLLLGQVADPGNTIVPLLERFFDSCDVEANDEKLRRRFENIHVTQTGPDIILEALRLYLSEDLKLDEVKVALVVEHGEMLLRGVVPEQVNSTLSLHPLVDTSVEGNQREGFNVGQPQGPTIIDDIRQFKASLAVTPGARPVRPLSEFEELTPKP